MFKDIDIVVHLAALLENQNPERIELVNVRGTENVLNALYQAEDAVHVPRILLTSILLQTM
jgi:nucleoside-diphosphate-sugar epimerase